MEVIYVLREVCGISTEDAKGVLHQVWSEMHTFHTRLLADLDALHAEMDLENGIP